MYDDETEFSDEQQAQFEKLPDVARAVVFVLCVGCIAVAWLIAWLVR